jgi:hypothetical protein
MSKTGRIWTKDYRGFCYAYRLGFSVYPCGRDMHAAALAPGAPAEPENGATESRTFETIKDGSAERAGNARPTPPGDSRDRLTISPSERSLPAA